MSPDNTKMSADRQAALDYHEQPRPGKLEIRATKPMATGRDLSLAYSPGVAEACLEIAREPAEARRYTAKGNLVAVISNGTAVLGLGDIGPQASKPVMEGKAVLFKKFAGIDCFDIEVDEPDPERLADLVCRLAPTFGAVNLEDIKAPDCFVVERICRERMTIPVFHDDQHGTAIVATAAAINAVQLAEKRLEDIRIVALGAGAAGIACLKMLMSMGARAENILMLDSKGVAHSDRADLSPEKAEFARKTPLRTIDEALTGADLFLGVSGPGLLTGAMVARMVPVSSASPRLPPAGARSGSVALQRSPSRVSSASTASAIEVPRRSSRRSGAPLRAACACPAARPPPRARTTDSTASASTCALKANGRSSSNCCANCHNSALSSTSPACNSAPSSSAGSSRTHRPPCTASSTSTC